MFESIINYFISFNDVPIIYHYCISPVVIGAIASLASSGMGLASQYFTNKKNRESVEESNDIIRQNNQFQQQAYLDEQKYNRELQERLFQREDTAYQRTADDLQEAGYSPLAINGTNNAGSVVGQAQMPELSGINPFQAESLNFGQLADIIGQADSRMLQERALDIQAAKNLSDKEQKELDRKEQARQADAKIELSIQQFSQTMDNAISQQKISNAREAKKLEMQKTQLENILQSSKLAEDKQHAEQAERELRQATGGRGSTRLYTDKAEYEEAITQWRQNYAEQLQQYAKKLTSATSKSEAGSASGGGGIATVASLNASSSHSTSESWLNLDESAKAELDSWLVKNPMPVHY